MASHVSSSPKISLSIPSTVSQIADYYHTLQRQKFNIHDIGIPAIGSPQEKPEAFFSTWKERIRNTVNIWEKAGIPRNLILVNMPSNQVAHQANGVSEAVEYLTNELGIHKIIAVMGNKNLPYVENYCIEQYIREIANASQGRLKIFAGLYPSAAMAYHTEKFGLRFSFDRKHEDKQIDKILSIDHFVDGYMTQMTFHPNNAANWLKQTLSASNHNIYLGPSAQTQPLLPIMCARTQLYSLTGDVKFKKVTTWKSIYTLLLKKPQSWSYILESLNIESLDMFLRFWMSRNNRPAELVKHLSLKLPIDIKNRIGFHYNSGMQKVEHSRSVFQEISKFCDPIILSEHQNSPTVESF